MNRGGILGTTRAEDVNGREFSTDPTVLHPAISNHEVVIRRLRRARHSRRTDDEEPREAVSTAVAVDLLCWAINRLAVKAPQECTFSLIALGFASIVRNRFII